MNGDHEHTQLHSHQQRHSHDHEAILTRLGTCRRLGVQSETVQSGMSYARAVALPLWYDGYYSITTIACASIFP